MTRFGSSKENEAGIWAGPGRARWISSCNKRYPKSLRIICGGSFRWFTSVSLSLSLHTAKTQNPNSHSRSLARSNHELLQLPPLLFFWLWFYATCCYALFIYLLLFYIFKKFNSILLIWFYAVVFLCICSFRRSSGRARRVQELWSPLREAFDWATHFGNPYFSLYVCVQFFSSIYWENEKIKWGK